MIWHYLNLHPAHVVIQCVSDCPQRHLCIVWLRHSSSPHLEALLCHYFCSWGREDGGENHRKWFLAGLVCSMHQFFLIIFVLTQPHGLKLVIKWTIKWTFFCIREKESEPDLMDILSGTFTHSYQSTWYRLLQRPYNRNILLPALLIKGSRIYWSKICLFGIKITLIWLFLENCRHM